MSDLDQVVRLWQQIEAGDEDCVLATIVRVEGSSYRKPGARMLVTASGRRAGTISGGCLEAEVSKQAWWLTQTGPVVKQFSTSFDADSDKPYGLGCGGTIHLLLERRAHAEPLLRLLTAAFASRQAVATAVVLEGPALGERFVGARSIAERCVGERSTLPASTENTSALTRLAREASQGRQSFHSGSVWAEYIAPRCGLFIFGAGDDAKPLVLQASTLGWHITVADGRAHLATRSRFPHADRVIVLKDSDITDLDLLESDAAVLMTHSYEQDSHLLRALLNQPLAYLGVLGPRYRTADLLQDPARALGGTPQEWAKRVHSPVGLDLGGDSPALIALSILAEVQTTLSRSALAKPVEVSRCS